MSNDEISKPKSDAPAQASEPPPVSEKPRVRKIVKSGGTVERVGGPPPEPEAPAPTQRSEAAPAGKPQGTPEVKAAPAAAAPAPAAAAPAAASAPPAGAPASGPVSSPRPEQPRPARPPFGDRGRPPRSDWRDRGSAEGGARFNRPPGGPGPRSGGGPRPDHRGPRRDAPEGRAPIGMRPAPGAENRAPLASRQTSAAQARARDERAPTERRPDRAPSPRPSSPGGAGAPPARASAPGAAKPAPRPTHAAWLGAPVPKAGVVHAKAVKPALTAREALAARTKAAQATKARPEGERAAAASAPEQSTLRPEWISAGWDDAENAAREAGSAASALVDAWAAAGNATAIAAVADGDDSLGACRKAARRALNVLKARGVTIPSRGPHVARFKDEGPETLEAMLTPPDASGTSVLSVQSRDASGRYRIAEVIVREPIGILHAGGGWVSGSQLKEGRARAVEALGVAPVVVPVEWARHRIAQARELNAKSRHVLPLGLDACRELIEPVPAAEPAHPLADLEASVTSEKAWAEAPGSAFLHGEPEFRSWLPDRGALEELLQKLGERLGPEGAREPEKVDEGLRAEIADATDRFFSPEVRAVVAGRVRDAAISLRARKGEAVATQALAIARAVKEAGLITSPPRDIPFLVGYFQKGISYLVQQGGGSLRVPVPAGSAATP